MAEAGGRKAAAKGGPRRSIPAIAFGYVKRSWALGLALLVLWLSWEAFYYLLSTLVLPPEAPPQVVELPLRADEQMLETSARAFAGVQAVETPRMPLGHYHQIDNWFQPDAFNDCTRSGCHAPLPHHAQKASRAFLNLHATSLHCGVCHMQTDQQPLNLTWYDLESGRATGAPAIVRAYALLMDETQRASLEPAEYQSRLVELIREAAHAAQDRRELNRVADHLAAYRPDSEIYHELLEAAKGVLPRHFRGEYGAKLALADPSTKRPRLGHPGSAAAVEEYLSKRERLAGAELDAVLTRVHTQRRATTRNCLDCHVAEGGLVDFGALGYPPARVEQLHAQTLRQMIQHIMEGQDFHLPTFLQGPGAPPAE